MDRTALFKASVKTIRTRNKALGMKDSGSSILNQKTKRTGYGAKARDVLNNISKLKTFLLEHRKDYIDAFCHLSSEVSNMTDIERDQIDNDAQMYMRTCSSAIRTLKTDASQQSGTDQGSVHREAVLELLEDYLKVVVRLYSEQRAIRVKRAVDRKRISRLQPEHKQVKQDKPTVPSSVLGKASSRDSSGEEVAVATVAVPLDPLTSAEDDITPEEAQMFEQENKKLFEEMNNLVDEVRQIEGKVVEISRLQEIFSEKVIQQAAVSQFLNHARSKSNQIDRLYDTAVHTTENVQEGNEQIRKAIKNNATFRVWILFFLIMCSFSLLFLDWYS